MKTIWTSEKDLFKQAANFREKLTEILSKRVKEAVVEPDYESPSWSHKQAHLNGYNQCVREIIEILKE